MPGPKLPFAVWGGQQKAQETEGAAIVWGARGKDLAGLIVDRVIIND